MNLGYVTSVACQLSAISLFVLAGFFMKAGKSVYYRQGFLYLAAVMVYAVLFFVLNVKWMSEVSSGVISISSVEDTQWSLVEVVAHSLLAISVIATYRLSAQSRSRETEALLALAKGLGCVRGSPELQEKLATVTECLSGNFDILYTRMSSASLRRTGIILETLLWIIAITSGSLILALKLKF